MSRKIIIDTDPGQDDAVAILLALASPELEVLALTAVAGNVHAYTAATDMAAQECPLGKENMSGTPISVSTDRPMEGRGRPTVRLTSCTTTCEMPSTRSARQTMAIVTGEARRVSRHRLIDPRAPPTWVSARQPLTVPRVRIAGPATRMNNALSLASMRVRIEGFMTRKCADGASPHDKRRATIP